jgi:hypothetical protein
MSLETYSRATQAGNLMMSDWRTLPVDWIAAAGACQIHGDPMPAMVARWLSGDHAKVFGILAELQRGFGKRRMLTNRARDEIVDACQWWHDRTCKQCQGRGHEQIPDAPMMSGQDCPVCGGNGLQRHLHRTEAYAYTLRELDAAAAVCGYVVSAKVA